MIILEASQIGKEQTVTSPHPQDQRFNCVELYLLLKWNLFFGIYHLKNTRLHGLRLRSTGISWRLGDIRINDTYSLLKLNQEAEQENGLCYTEVNDTVFVVRKAACCLHIICVDTYQRVHLFNGTVFKLTVVSLKYFFLFLTKPFSVKIKKFKWP